jgi:hypothetical protein
VEVGIESGTDGVVDFSLTLVAVFPSMLEDVVFTPVPKELAEGISLPFGGSPVVVVADVVAVFVPGGGVMLGLIVLGKPLALAVVTTLDVVGGAPTLVVAGGLDLG